MFSVILGDTHPVPSPSRHALRISWRKPWWLYFESELKFMTCNLCVKHTKSNVMTGNKSRNWKASTLKRHAHSADHKQSDVAKAMTWSFSVSNVFNEKRKSHAAILSALNFKYPNLPMSKAQLTKSGACLRLFPYVILILCY